MRTLLAFGLVFGLAGLAKADDKKKADPTGTWKWEQGMGDRKRTVTLKLKMDGDKLTGSMLGRMDMEMKLDDLAMKDGEITFSVTRMMMDNKIVTKYKLKLDGDTLKGTSETDVGGNVRKADIEAKKEKSEEKKKDK